MSLLVSLCGRLKCIQKSPGDNEGPAFLLSLSEPLAGKKRLLCIWQQSELDPETSVAGVPDGGLSSPGSPGVCRLWGETIEVGKRRENDENQKETELMRRIQSKQTEQRLYSRSLSWERQSADGGALQSVSYSSLVPARLVVC